MAGFWGVVSESWRHHVIDEGRLPALALLGGFVVAFGAVRAITHLIRAGRGPFHDLAVSGTHVHHLVYGIFLMLGSGYVGFAVDPSIPGWILPAVFGVGAALTLDEFALWLRLEDVYWAEAGRASVDAVLIALAVIGVAVAGAPFWHAVYTKTALLAALTLGIGQLLVVALSVVAWVKGKRLTAAIGLLIPPRRDRRGHPARHPRLALGAMAIRRRDARPRQSARHDGQPHPSRRPPHHSDGEGSLHGVFRDPQLPAGSLDA